MKVKKNMSYNMIKNKLTLSYLNDSDFKKGISKPNIEKIIDSKFPLIDLPDSILPNFSLKNAIQQRRSIRNCSSEELSLKTISNLLWATQGKTTKNPNIGFACPSGGECYPIETYLLVNNIKNLIPGVYHYSRYQRKLSCIAQIPEISKQLQSLLHPINRLYKNIIKFPVIFVWTAIPYRSFWKFKEESYKLCYLEAGHIGQNFGLAATSMKLVSCMIDGYLQNNVDTLLQLNTKEEISIYLATAGNPPKV